MLLDVQNLTVNFRSHREDVTVVKNLSFQLEKGKTLAIVGESGSGKSVTAMSIPRLINVSTLNYSKDSKVLLNGTNLLSLPNKEIQAVRRNKIGYIFQEPMTALNPVIKIGAQVTESLLYSGMNAAARKERMMELFELMHLPNPERIANSYAHQLSGGQRQRVVIAMAIANNPELLIADEPTTALDVTVQASIIELLKDLQQKLDIAMLFISHDLGVVAKVADEILVMREGVKEEQEATNELLNNPQKEYTKQLLDSIIDWPCRGQLTDQNDLLSLKDVSVSFTKSNIFSFGKKTEFHAVKNVNFDVKQGESVGLVGESGSGKSTLGRSVLRLNDFRGQITWRGRDIRSMSAEETKQYRQQIQVVFQDPYSSLSPRRTMEQIVCEGLDVHRPDLPKHEKRGMIDEVLEQVSIDPNLKSRFVHEFSGGQRQRIAIARSLILKPQMVIMDEPTSALDASVQKEVVELLEKLREDYNLSFFFISHDMSVIRAMCSRVYIMQNGSIVESGPTEQVFNYPETEYAVNLLGAAKEYSIALS